jgi:hypothetical protein
MEAETSTGNLCFCFFAMIPGVLAQGSPPLGAVSAPFIFSSRLTISVSDKFNEMIAVILFRLWRRN